MKKEDTKGKECSKCENVYPLTFEYFYRRKDSKDGYHSICKGCLKGIHDSYRQKNKDKIRESMRGYRQKNSEAIREKKKEYYLNNKDEIVGRVGSNAQKNKEQLKEYRHKYYRDNKDSIKKQAKIYAEKNKDKIRDRTRKYRIKNEENLRKYKKKYYQNNKKNINKYCRERSKYDLEYRIVRNLRTRLSKVIKRCNAQKSNHTMNLLGCSMNDFLSYIESKFKEGMSWSNYGKLGWHIDHIRPCVSFDLTKPEEQNKCFHYSNLQPLWEKENLTKNSNYNGKLIRKRR
jgi:hypothetical protein